MARGGISHNAGEIVKRMLGRKAGVIRELSTAARELAPALNAESKRILSAKVYSVPVARGPRSGKPQWKRTGALLNAEKARAEGVDIVLTNNSEHAGPRFRLGTSDGRQIRSPGVQSVQWQTEAIANKRTVILARRRKAVLKALQVG